MVNALRSRNHLAILLAAASFACPGPEAEPTMAVEAGADPSPDLSASITLKLRGVTLPLLGWEGARPNDHVDVLFQGSDPATREGLALTMVQNVVVLGVGDLVERDAGPQTATPRMVTLQVLPEESEMLTFAATRGTLQLALRNPEDLDVQQERGRATMNSLLAGGRMKSMQTLRYRTIQIIRGAGGKGGGSGGSEHFSYSPQSATLSPKPKAEAAPQPLMDRAVRAKPGKIVYRDETGQFKPLAIRALRTVVHIEGPRARTVVDMVVENTFDRTLEGSLRYPLPQDASPAYFATFQGAPSIDPHKLLDAPGDHKQLLPDLEADAGATASLSSITPREGKSSPNWQQMRVARVVAKEQGTQVYERVVRRRVDPALLEWSGGNDFEARVYPIPAHSLKRVVVVYEQSLPRDSAFLQYSFPLPEKAIPEFTAHLYVDGAKAEITTLWVGGENRESSVVGKAGPFLSIDLALSNQAFSKDLVVAMRPKNPRAQLLVGGGDAALPGAFVYGKLIADFPEVTATHATGDAIFLVDTSLSEEGDRARLAGQMLEAVLEGDATIQRFNVLLFDVRAQWLHPTGLRNNSAENRAETLRELQQVNREGATSFEAAFELLEATTWLPAGATAFLLSDGQATWGESSARLLLKRSPRSASLRWIAYRFGDGAINRELFNALTQRTGQVVTCLAGSQVAAAALAHRKPMMQVESIAVEGATVHDFVARGSPQALFPGQEIEVAGRALGGKPASGSFVVTGALDGKPISLRYPFETKGSDMLAPRAWAELHVERLLDLGSKRLDRLVIALSQHFGMTHRLASMLVLETDQEYTLYDLKLEQLSIAEVEAEAKSALARERKEEGGLDLSKLPPAARALLEKLPSSASADPLARLSLTPFAGGEKRAYAERVFHDARKRSPDDLMAFHALGLARREAGDLLGAERALSSIVELRSQDAEALRLTGFMLMAQGLYSSAAEILGRLRSMRSFEVQTYLEEAVALEAAGRIREAARNYEIVLSRNWTRHSEVTEAGRQHYVQLLRRHGGQTLGTDSSKLALDRASVLGNDIDAHIDLQVTIHWNVDDIDIDLWVTGPDHEKCYYGYKDTSSGGRLFWDTTTGYGPELFQQRRMQKGRYLAQVHYFGNNSEQWAIPSVVMGILDERPSDPFRHRRRFNVELLTRGGESVRDLFQIVN